MFGTFDLLSGFVMVVVFLIIAACVLGPSELWGVVAGIFQSGGTSTGGGNGSDPGEDATVKEQEQLRRESESSP